MTITLSLPPEREQTLFAQAKARGVSLDVFLQAIITTQAAAPAEAIKMLQDIPGDGEELDRAFEETADLVPTGTPILSDEARSRESIYTREDAWNKSSR